VQQLKPIYVQKSVGERLNEAGTVPVVVPGDLLGLDWHRKDTQSGWLYDGQAVVITPSFPRFEGSLRTATTASTTSAESISALRPCGALLVEHLRLIA
jgi:hypothetical protein